MIDQLVLHNTVCLPQADYDALIAKLEEAVGQIPASTAVLNKEMKNFAKMGDKKESDAVSKLAILKKNGSFLPPELAWALMNDKLTAFKQSNGIKAIYAAINDKTASNGDLSGIDLGAMLSIVDALSLSSAALGNADAIKYLNEWEKVKTAKKAEAVMLRAAAAKAIKKAPMPKAK
jgi:hypothetical protein